MVLEVVRKIAGSELPNKKDNMGLRRLGITVYKID